MAKENDNRMSIRLPDDLRKKLERLAKADRRSLASYVRKIVEDALEKNEDK